MRSRKTIKEISHIIIGCAIEVHKELGPGLLESIYEACFIEELKNAGLTVRSQVYFPIHYKGKQLDKKFKIDLLVEDLIIVEDKAVEIMIPLYKAQLLSYMKLADIPKGLLINFNCEHIKDHLVSLVSNKYFNLPE